MCEMRHRESSALVPLLTLSPYVRHDGRPLRRGNRILWTLTTTNHPHVTSYTTDALPGWWLGSPCICSLRHDLTAVAMCDFQA
jgi:hypothetical protein